MVLNPGLRCGLLDLSYIDTSEKITVDQTTWVGCEVDPKLRLHIPYGEATPSPHAVITFNDPCYATICSGELSSLQGVQWFFRNVLIRNATNNQNPNTTVTIPNETSSLNEMGQAAQNAAGAAGRAVDTAALNSMEFQPAAAFPAAAAVPMISKIDSYGPWVSTNFGGTADEGAFGGIHIEVNADLVPWNYGSSVILNNVANTLVNSNNIGLTRQENGSFTIPGLPQQVYNIGQGIGTYGPLLTSINFTYGNSVTTSYEFRTYTPKFGKLSKSYIDKFKQFASKRREMTRFLKIQSINQYKARRRLAATRLKQNMNKMAASKQASLQRVIVGEMYDLYKIGNGENAKPAQRTVVGTSTLDKSSTEMIYDYDKKAYMSLDGIWSPVSLNGDGDLPRLSLYDKNSLLSQYATKNLPQNPYPPFFKDGPVSNLGIHSTYLNPLTNQVTSNNHHITDPGCGHSIDMVGRENAVLEDGMLRSFYSINDNNRYSEDYRFLAMKGPLVLHSWGYDTEGKPIPNESDTDDNTKNGSFTSTNLKDTFLSNWLGKPATWPVAPIDLRFDRKRGVWVSPPGPKIVRAVLDGDLISGLTVQAGILFDHDVYDGTGETIEDEEGKIVVYEKLGNCYASGTTVYCYYNNGQYIVLEGGNIGCDYCPPPSGTNDPSGKEKTQFTIGRLDLKSIPGWDPTKQQVLTHTADSFPGANNGGCLEWIDTTTCE